MGLTEYKRKRDFKQTPEPEGKFDRSKHRRFVVQRHDASRLHYDFRLEMDGVLKSWAVPKGPSKNPGDKRLAMMVEDHPVNYIGFYGSIPEGNYGAGTVDIWDEGNYTPVDPKGEPVSDQEALKALDNGNLKFSLKGKHLKGEFALVRMKADENSWLLIKHRDKYSTDKDYSSEDEKPIKLHKSGGTWSSNRNATKKKSNAGSTSASKRKSPDPKSNGKQKNASEQKKAARFTRFNPGRKLDKFISPMLASLGDEPFDNPDWIFELKWDGYRAIAECNGTNVKLYSRNGLSFNERYPVIVQELSKMKLKAVLDGEVVLFNEDDRPDFQKLQHYDDNRDLPLIYYAFDLLEINNKDISSQSLLERKKLLKKTLKKSSVIRYSDHIEEKGIAFFNEVKKKGLEGIMAKKAESEYTRNIRTREWLKIKNTLTREAVVCGYTEGKGSRQHFGALVLGEFKRSKLHYIGHTGTGFNTKSLKEIWTLMQQYKRDSSPFDEKIPVNGLVTWLNPKLVCEVKYSEITRDGILRHPVFLHIRDDKKPAEVTPEPEPVHATEVTNKTSKVKKSAASTTIKSRKSTPPKEKKTQVAKKKQVEPSRQPVKKGNSHIIVANKQKVEISNPDKIYWPDEKLTKGDMVNYYNEVADFIIPYLRNRPLSLLRNPNGITEKGFFHKNAGDVAPDWMTTAKIYSESGDKYIRYLVCNDKASLLFIANLGCIEMNPWNSTTKKEDYPTWMVIDIDPSDNNTFDDVIETAQVVRQILDRAKVNSYCKTSGASGLHVYVPMGERYNYDQVKDFANLVAMMVTDELPDLTTLERSLSKRSTNKIYVDYLQNRRGQTLATAYSLRPKPGATVSMPLEWKEVKPGLHPSDFNIQNAFSRLKKKGDIFSPVLGKGIDLAKTLKALG
jgi:bifunctional non-homologous end joining protein LigD